MNSLETLKCFYLDTYEGLFTNQHTYLNLQSGAMIMATTTELARSGTVMLRTVTWWAAPVWAAGKESSSVNPVSKAKFFTVESKQLSTFKLVDWRSLSAVDESTCYDDGKLYQWETSGRRSTSDQYACTCYGGQQVTLGFMSVYFTWMCFYITYIPMIKPLLSLRAGAVRTVVVLVLKLMWTSFSLQCALMLTTATGRTPFANWWVFYRCDDKGFENKESDQSLIIYNLKIIVNIVYYHVLRIQKFGIGRFLKVE